MSPVGGKRPGAGRPSEYGEPTDRITIRIPARLLDWLRAEAARRETSVSRLLSTMVERASRRGRR